MEPDNTGEEKKKKEEQEDLPKEKVEEVKEVKSRRPRKKRTNPQEIKRSLSSPGGLEPDSTSEEEERRRGRRSSVSGEPEQEAPRPTLRRNKAKKEAKKLEETLKEESAVKLKEKIPTQVEAVKKEENVPGIDLKEKKEEEASKEKEEKVKEGDKNIQEEKIKEGDKNTQEEKIKEDDKNVQEKKSKEEPKIKEEPQTKEELEAETTVVTEAREWWKAPWSKWGHKKDSILAKESKIIEIIPPEVAEEEKSGLRRRFAAAEKEEEEEEEVEEEDLDELWKPDDSKPLAKARTWKDALREIKKEYKKFTLDHPKDADLIRKLRNRCISDLILIFIICGCGAFVFKTTEGSFESFYKCGVKRVKRDFIDELWRSSHFKREDEWKSFARKKLMDFENQLHEAFEAGMKSYSGQRSWSFLNALIYCFTVVTTIGYGHIAPTTNTGRALTIIYAVFGIPMFLILLADFGKLFTRGIKWIWAFVRRVYYTGTCKKVRKTEPVQEVMKGVQVMYDMALFRRGSQQPPGGVEGCPPNDISNQTPVSVEPPSTPAPSQFAIDDEFNIPITVALTILLLYIFGGACLFYVWEDSWSFFEAFYFVFISMSTIGFGDFVPQNKMYMMGSIVYLVFGLALTSMCINVVQEKLSDTFRKATAKIGATIGLRVCQDDGTVTPATPAKVELAQVHNSHKS